MSTDQIRLNPLHQFHPRSIQTKWNTDDTDSTDRNRFRSALIRRIGFIRVLFILHKSPLADFLFCEKLKPACLDLSALSPFHSEQPAPQRGLRLGVLYLR